MSSKAYLGNVNLDNMKIGSSGLKMYLGDELIYPIDDSVAVTYYDESGNTQTILCKDLAYPPNLNYDDAQRIGTGYTSVVIGDCVEILNAGGIGGGSWSTITSVTCSDSVVQVDTDFLPSGVLEVVFGTGLTTVDRYAFEYINGLQSITFNGSTPPTFNADWETDSNQTFTIYVPCTAIEDYRTALTGKTANLNDRLRCIPSAFKFKVKYINVSTGVETLVEVPDDGTTTITEGMIQEDLQALGYNSLMFKEITFGDNIHVIDSLAMLGTENLSSITLSDSITTLSAHAFTVDDNIPTSNRVTTLHIPASVTSIGTSALVDLPLTSITIDTGNASFYVENNCLISNAKTLVKGTTSSVIPNDIVTIGSQSFEGVSLSTLPVIPASVTSINSYAFYRAYLPTNAASYLTVYGALTYIGEAAFASFNDRTGVETTIEVPTTNPEDVTIRTATIGGHGIIGGNGSANRYLYVAEGTVEEWQNIIEASETYATSKSNLNNIIDGTE